jgi:predicted O-linked N-acetylglucosamine transferase (SPINDLY family)
MAARTDVNRQAARTAAAAPPLAAEAIMEGAIRRHQRGELAAAEALYRQVLAGNPDHLDALQLLGVVEFQRGRPGVAVDLLQRALRLAPAEAGLHCNLGLALEQAGRGSEALASLDRALALRPDFAEAHNNRGNVLRSMGRLAEAEAAYRQALALRPDFPEALYNLGRQRLERDDPAEALGLLERSLRLQPRHGEALVRAGAALLALERPQEALMRLEAACREQPDDAEAVFLKSNALLALGQKAAAAAGYRHARRLRPDSPEIRYNLATTLADLGQPAAAVAEYEAALALRPDYPAALYNLAGTLQELGRHAAAVEVFDRLLALAPAHRYAQGKQLHSRKFCCDWSTHDQQASAIVAAVAAGGSADVPFSFLALTDDPALQLQCATLYTQQRYPAQAPLAGAAYRHPRLRIAYLSPDFREHPVSYLLAGVFEAHDRQRFETIGVSLGVPDDSAMGRRVAAAFEHFIDASALDDAQAAARLRALEVDVAIDLTGYTENNRSGILARRPAPVQVNYLGYPGTMGAGYLDYILADRYLIPEAEFAHYREAVVWLPDCFQGNDSGRPPVSAASRRQDWGLPEDGFVFCAFNNTHKFNPALFRLWLRLLRAVPDSVLWIAAEAGCVIDNLRAEAVRHGVDSHRLVFSPRVAYPEHLARLPLADLFLDTLPFNAGTTASDALWAGLPVLTCSGRSYAGRMAGSLLTALGLPELITARLADYEARALALATEPARLAAIRARLARQRTAAPLFDSVRFCRHLEAACETMAARCQRGEAPSHLAVPRGSAP